MFFITNYYFILNNYIKHIYLYILLKQWLKINYINLNKYILINILFKIILIKNLN